LTIVSKRASKVFSNPQHGGNRDFGGGGGGPAKLENGNIFSKTKYYFYFLGQCFYKTASH
jgi:hypothetical protein